MSRKTAAESAESSPPEIPILEIRGQRVVLDRDLAALYGVATHRLNEQVSATPNAFPQISPFNSPSKSTRL